MPVIRVVNTGQEIETNSAVSVLNALLRNAVPIMHQCGGKAVCGTCRIRVISGSEYLSPKTEREITRLAAMKAGPDVRLACQTYTRKDIEVEILNRIPVSVSNTINTP